MPTEFKLPKLGEGVESADVSRVLVAEGDTIEADQDVLELETEKAVAQLPCPLAGRVEKIHVSEGDTVEVGQVILTVEEAERDETESEGGQTRGAPTQRTQTQGEQRKAAETRRRESAAEEKRERRTAPEEQEQGDTKTTAAARETAVAEEAERQTQAVQQSQEQQRQEGEEKKEEEERAAEQEQKPSRERRSPPEKRGEDKGEIHVAAGPATRRLARKLDVDLDEIQLGEGSNGRVTSEDVVRAHLAQIRGQGAPSAPKLPDFGRFGPVRREERNRIALRTSEHLSTSWRLVPHVTQHGRADITQLEQVRRQYAESAGENAPKVTITAVAVKAVASLLRKHPKFNSSLDVERNELIVKQYYHIGVAVDTEHGLLVPVIRDVDRKTIRELAAELSELADAARSRKLSREQMEGGTFTVSNQGGIGGDIFTPIINYPEVAILGLGRAEPAVKLLDGRPEERLLLPLSLSYDHRVLNGADAARFVAELSRLLSAPAQLVIDA